MERQQLVFPNLGVLTRGCETTRHVKTKTRSRATPSLETEAVRLRRGSLVLTIPWNEGWSESLDRVSPVIFT